MSINSPSYLVLCSKLYMANVRAAVTNASKYATGASPLVSSRPYKYDSIGSSLIIHVRSRRVLCRNSIVSRNTLSFHTVLYERTSEKLDRVNIVSRPFTPSKRRYSSEKRILPFDSNTYCVPFQFARIG